MLFDIGGRVELYLCRLFCIVTEEFNPDLFRWILTIATARTVLEENITRRQKKPEHVAAHRNCELAGWYFREWEKANSKLTIAGEKGSDIISLCRSRYGSFTFFKAETLVNIFDDKPATFGPCFLDS